VLQCVAGKIAPLLKDLCAGFPRLLRFRKRGDKAHQQHEPESAFLHACLLLLFTGACLWFLVQDGQIKT
jgi:hypothetical protein